MIVKMKFMSITGPKSDIDRVTEQYLSKYEIHLENALSELTKMQHLTPYLEINPYRDALQNVQTYYDELGDKKPEPQPISLDEALSKTDEMKQKVQSLTSQDDELRKQKDDLQRELDLITPFRSLDYKISSMVNFDFVKCRFGRIEKAYYDKFIDYIYNTLDTYFLDCQTDGSYVWGVYFVPRRQMERIDAIYASMHFEWFKLPAEYEGTPDEEWQLLSQQMDEITRQLDANRETRLQYLNENAQFIVSAREKLDALSTGFDVRKMAACTGGNKDPYYILCGWMSEEDAENFQKDVEKDDSLFCTLEDQDHNVVHQPPTKLKNPRLFKPFEMYTRMYGLPCYDEMDPTWFVAITYSFIFGAMFGDFGQGLVLMIGGYLLYKFRHSELAGIIGCAGFFSAIFGLLFGSFFGYEDVIPALWLKPDEHTMVVPFIGELNTVFLVAIVFGMFLIIVCMIFHIINAVRQHDLEEIWFDNNSVAGLVFYVAVVAVVMLYMTSNPLPATVVLVIMFVVPLLVIFFKEPLTNLVTRKSKLIEGGVGMFFVQGFFEMFEMLLAYFSNTLSFVRIGAFAVSHAAIMEVVLMLAGAESAGTGNMAVIIFGNIFVMGLEGLVVGIQVLRLEYYEFFSRFYKGNGRAFQPFQLKKASK